MEAKHSNLDVEIDGSLFEGGGQMFRNSLALATILGKTVQVSKIRAGRPNPGLNHQLRTGINVMTQVSHCVVEGDFLKSQQVTYRPREIRSGITISSACQYVNIILGQFKGDCHTAGSIALMIQMVLPSLLFAKKGAKVTLMGGTLVNKSPPVRYFSKILFPILQRIGVNVDMKIMQEGYFPSGGGEVVLEVEPLMGKPLEPIVMKEKGKITNVYIQVIVKEDDEAVANSYIKEISNIIKNIIFNNVLYSIEKGVKKIMREQYSEEEVDGVVFETEYDYSENLMKAGLSRKIKEFKNNKAKNYKPSNKGPKKIVYGVVMFAYGDGVYYDCSAVCIGGDDDEQYVDKVLDHFKNNFASKSGIDEYLQDQLLIFMLMAKGKSSIKCAKPISDHTTSCFYVFKEFLPNFEYKLIEEEGTDLVTIEIEGLSIGQNRFNTALDKVETN